MGEIHKVSSFSHKKYAKTKTLNRIKWKHKNVLCYRFLHVFIQHKFIPLNDTIIGDKNNKKEHRNNPHGVGTKGETGRLINRENFCFDQSNTNYLMDHLVLQNEN